MFVILAFIAENPHNENVQFQQQELATNFQAFWPTSNLFCVKFQTKSPPPPPPAYYFFG